MENVSFKIEPGQMVVIVGVNGSGKSSAIKLFNRLYDPTEGEILVDDLPLSSYKLKDVRQAMAILRQDHICYPLNMRLNVALGCPDNENPTDEELVKALKGGGADKFVEKLPKKLDTELHVNNNSYLTLAGQGVVSYDRKEMVYGEGINGMSGGESQRLAASVANLLITSIVID